MNLTFGPTTGDKSTKTLRLSTASDGSLLFDYIREERSVFSNIPASGAMALRDALLKLYPLTQPRTYSAHYPSVGDLVQVKKPVDTDRRKLNDLVAPLTVTELCGAGCIKVRDVNGKSFMEGFFANRFEAYAAPSQADIKLAEIRGRAEGFSQGLKASIDRAEAARKSKQPKWETVTDALDRVKVEGGYIYQNESDNLVFVPSNPSAKPGVTGACTYKAPCSARREF